MALWALFKQAVSDYQASDPGPVLSSVPKNGSVLGAIIFLVFINDLLDKIRSFGHLFVIKFVLYRNIKVMDCLILQDDLARLGSSTTILVC